MGHMKCIGCCFKKVKMCPKWHPIPYGPWAKEVHYIGNRVLLAPPSERVVSSVPWNDDSVLVVFQFEGEGVLLSVLGGRNANTSLGLLYVLHEFKIQI